MSNYELIQGFIKKEFLDSYIDAVQSFIKRFYTTENLQNHTAYFSDHSNNRDSFAFTISTCSGPSVLPSIPLQHVAQSSRKLSLLNLKMREILDVSENSRLMMNVQIYRGNSKPVTVHYDGEYFDFSVNEDDSLHVNSGLRPEKVAVLVLHNESSGGTRIHTEDGLSQVVVGNGGDLLVFDNINCRHSVDELTGTSTRKDGILRMTIGWRSLDENTQEIVDGKTVQGRVQLNRARSLHHRFLRDRWPAMYQSFADNNRKKAF